MARGHHVSGENRPPYPVEIDSELAEKLFTNSPLKDRSAARELANSLAVTVAQREFLVEQLRRGSITSDENKILSGCCNTIKRLLGELRLTGEVIADQVNFF